MNRKEVGFVSALALAVSVSCAHPATEGPPATLRSLYGLVPVARLDVAKTALVLVDFQQEFFSGRLPVDAGHAAVARAAELRAWASSRGIAVFHVRNVVTRPGSLLFSVGSPTVAFVPALQPREREVVITKSQAGAFSNTDLHGRLRERGIDTLIVAGIMTHLAVDTTVRDAGVLGYHVIVAADACATRALPSPLGGPAIAARDVQRVALASLADRFADVADVETITGLSSDRDAP